MGTYHYRILLLVLLCFTGIHGYAQTWNWVSHNNPDNSDFINIVADQNGYTYTSMVDKAGFVLTKYKPNGVKIWSKRNPGALVLKLSIDATGHLYTVGTDSFSPFNSSLVTAKLDSAGNRLWTKGNPVPPLPNDLPSGYVYTGATDAAGNTYMSGEFRNLTQFDTIALSNLAPINYFLAKYNSAGKIQWLRFFNDPVYSIACGSQGSYFIECGTHFQKYAANGTLIWQQNFSGTFDPSIFLIYSNKFIADAQDNLYVLGSQLAKYNSNGTLAWIKANQTPPGGTFKGKDFALNSSGNLLVTGSFSGTVSLGNGVPNLIGDTTGSPLFVAGFSGATSNALWAKQNSTSDYCTGEAIVSLPNGSCVIAGNFKANSAFDQLSLTGKGVFTAKLSAGVLGVHEGGTKTNLQVYPNPATSEVTLTGHLKPGTLEVYSLTGQKVYETSLTPEMKLKVADWPAGMYLVKITSEGKTQIQKLLVTR
ncbi:T9SS type A sorting domain-containing protein [Adhaeribacter soli]|uniref:T9SS type A sorting domain-containing protein n=1 Tax=Adhaeribacter soli TaxID=2607655 RepID=A0A5N1J0B2_9BACT|nr:T9SS type A sorting domain-containing protein [Adhaeribacter soli]KAA9340060.1 T9SS type A sorting domain-containing protein [Adhaeribacter soli]